MWRGWETARRTFRRVIPWASARCRIRRRPRLVTLQLQPALTPSWAGIRPRLAAELPKLWLTVVDGCGGLNLKLIDVEAPKHAPCRRLYEPVAARVSRSQPGSSYAELDNETP